MKEHAIIWLNHKQEYKGRQGTF